MRILVTGGAGFIGSHIVEYYQDKADVIVLDNLRTGNRANLEGFDAEFVEGSILDCKLLQQVMEGVDYVYHLAAMVSVPESVARPAECIEVNSKGTLNVLEAAATAGARKLSFSSSAAVYGERPENPKTETLPPDPRSPYAVTKLSGENLCHMFAATGRLPTVSLRYFNVYGPRQDPNSAYAAAIPAFISRALQNEALTIFGDGLQTRDFIYVKDVVAANVHACTETPETGVFNVARGESLTINDLTTTVKRVTGSRCEIKHGPPRPGDVRFSEGANDKIRKTGFTPAVALQDGMQQTVRHFTQEQGCP